MATLPRVLTNHYQDCKVIKLDSRDPKSPLVVMQEGYAPNDSKSRMQMFYLQRDGSWINEIARSTLPDAQAGDIIFETTADALRALSGLTGKPHVRELPVTEADVHAYVSRVKGHSPDELLREFLSRYRAAIAKA